MRTCECVGADRLCFDCLQILFVCLSVCLFFCFGFTFQCVFLLVAHRDCCFGFVPRLVFILRCKTTISVLVCLLRIIASPVYVLVYPVDVSFWLDVLYLIQIA